MTSASTSPSMATGPAVSVRASGTLAAMVALGTAGVSTFLAMPVVASALVSQLGASEREIGLFSTVQLVTLSVGCLFSTFLPSGNLRRNGAAALAVMLICDALCLTRPEWSLFLVLRGLGGAAGGVAVSQATAAMARTANPERSFGLFLALQTIISIVCIYAVPALVARGGFYMGYGVLLTFDAAALLLVIRLLGGVHIGRSAATHAGNTMADWLRSFALLGSIMAFFVGVGAIWTFLALMGERITLGESQVAMVLSISKVVAFVASFLPGLLLTRLGRRLPIIGSVVLLVSAVLVYRLSGDLMSFIAATVLFSTGWYVIYPFQLGALGSVDRDGRPMLAAAALTGAGLGIGPALTVLAGDGLSGIYIISAGAFALAGLLALVAIRKVAPQAAGELHA